MEKTEEFHFKVSAIEQGQRLDQYIIKNLNFVTSRTQIQRLIKSNFVTVNQKIKNAHYKVKENDLVLIKIPPPLKPQALPENIPLEIIFEDEDILVINKSAGLVTHPAVGNYSHTLVNALLNYGCALSTINGPLRPGIVHRLDKDTSGLVVIAKNDFAHQKLAQQFQKHSVKRKYIAIVKGKVLHSEGLIDYPIARHTKNRQKMAVSFLKNGKSAITRFKVLKRSKEATVLELVPYTGRTHQLRVHLKFLGHPILGDRRYGNAGDFSRLALHAVSLGFYHPRTEKFLQFQVDIPGCFQKFMETLR